jgi:hypothetical protein
MTTEHDIRMRALKYIDPNKRKPLPLTTKQRFNKWVEKHQIKQRSVKINPQVDDMLFYLREQWDIPTHTEAIYVAISHLAAQTRRGLQRIDLDSD